MKFKKQLLFIMMLFSSFFLVGCGKKKEESYVDKKSSTINLQKFYDENITFEVNLVKDADNLTTVTFTNNSKQYLNAAPFKMKDKKTQTEIFTFSYFCLEPEKQVTYYAKGSFVKEDLELKGEENEYFFEDKPYISDDRLSDIVYANDIEIVDFGQAEPLKPEDEYSNATYVTANIKNNSGREFKFKTSRVKFYGYQKSYDTTKFGELSVSLVYGTEPIRDRAATSTDFELKDGDNPIIIQSYYEISDIQYEFTGYQLL